MKLVAFMASLDTLSIGRDAFEGVLLFVGVYLFGEKWVDSAVTLLVCCVDSVEDHVGLLDCVSVNDAPVESTCGAIILIPAPYM